MSDVIFTNFHLENDTYYFLYLGELKNYGLNVYLKEALARIMNRPVDFISIVPDVFEQYNYTNLVVINPLSGAFTTEHGGRLNCRLSADAFMSCVSGNPQVVSLVEDLCQKQGHVYLYLYESTPALTLDCMPGVSILGPDSACASRLNSKIYQYRSLDAILPIPEFHICPELDDVLKTAKTMLSRWSDGIFVSREFSAAGMNSMVALNVKDIANRFHNEKGPYLVSRYIRHAYDPTVLAVVANEKDIYFAGVADQYIEQKTRFTGSRFPSVLGQETKEVLRSLTVIVGKWLASEGYRGIFGCDYLVDQTGKVYFVEVNARKQGTTLEFCCTLEHSLPPGSPMLPELEYYAVTAKRFPENTVEMTVNPRNIHWGTYNYKLDKNAHTHGYIPHDPREREAFSKIASGFLKKDFLILEHTGSNFVLADGTFLGRIVALGQDHTSVEEGIIQGKKMLEITIDKDIQTRSDDA